MTSALINLCATTRAGMNDRERQDPSIENVVIHTIAALVNAVSAEPKDMNEAQEQRYVLRFLKRHLME